MAEGGRAGRWLRLVEGVVYWTVIAPLAACLPAVLAYRVACWRGDWNRRMWPEKHAEVLRLIPQVMGDEKITVAEAERVVREIFRFRACEVIDVMRLRGSAQSLRRLVEIRGREHLDAALAGGKGALLSTAHFWSHQCTFSVLNASGYPVSTIGRWDWKYDPAVPPAQKRFWDLAYSRRVLRHRHRPNMEQWPGRIGVAVQAAGALRENEFLAIYADAGPLAADQPRSVELPFLGQKARVLPGAVSIAKLTGAPMLSVFMYRSPDYRHQTLEISPPVSMQGDTETAFARCVAAVEAAILRNPAMWGLWFETDVLIRLGLVPAAPPEESSADELQGITR